LNSSLSLETIVLNDKVFLLLSLVTCRCVVWLMRLGVRKKLVLFSVVVGLLPLVAATVTLAVSAYRMRVNTLAQSSLSLAQAEATGRSLSLTHAIELIQIAMREQTTLAQLRQVTHRRSDEELRELDAALLRARPLPSPNDPRLQAALDNSAASLMRAITESDPRFGNIILADRFGQLVAAAERPRHFDFANDPWFADSFAEGKGLVNVYPVARDEKLGGYGIAVAVPVGPPGQVQGVVRFVLKLDRWMEPIASLQISQGMEDAGLMLVGDDGAILYRRDTTTMPQTMPQWDDVRTAGTLNYRMTHDELQAYAPIRLPQTFGEFSLKAPTWWLVFHMPREQITGPLWTSVAYTMGAGLLVIVALFMTSVLLIERLLTRRLIHLHHATQRVAQGDLDHRIQMPPHRFLGNDELDQLAAGFNRMIDNVRQSTRDLQSANQLKSNFIIIAGHELRTPLNYILNTARLYKNANDPARMRQALETIAARAQRFNEIIQAMFKLMPDGLRHGNMHYADVRLDELLEEIRAHTALLAEPRGQRLVVDTPPPLPTLRADREKLRDILENLLTNAVKFTPDGKTITLRASAEPPGSVTFRVQDEGPGIAPEEYEHLFKPFFTGGDPMVHTSNKYGIGLGLPIVRYFTDLHGGTVEVASSPLGCTVNVTIPVTPPDGAAAK